jgi:hypothetical protein
MRRRVRGVGRRSLRRLTWLSDREASGNRPRVIEARCLRGWTWYRFGRGDPVRGTVEVPLRRRRRQARSLPRGRLVTGTRKCGPHAKNRRRRCECTVMLERREAPAVSARCVDGPECLRRHAALRSPYVLREWRWASREKRNAPAAPGIEMGAKPIRANVSRGNEGACPDGRRNEPAYAQSSS